MKSNFMKIVKIYLLTLIIFSGSCFIYALMIKDKPSTSNHAMGKIIIGALTFFILGILSSNYHQKKGLLTAFLYSIFVLSVIIICLIVVDNTFDFMMFVKYAIFIICSLIGGIFGVNIKKFI